MRGFEKISYEQFIKDIKDDSVLYSSYELPKRGTLNSAGYDFFVLEDIVIKPGETHKTPTGVKVRMQHDEVLLIIIRSSIGYKHNIVLPNQTGVIDSDYYNNSENEGHLFIAIRNDGAKEFTIKKGDRLAQGIFIKYLTVDNEESITKTRQGGLGSTSKGD